MEPDMIPALERIEAASRRRSLRCLAALLAGSLLAGTALAQTQKDPRLGDGFEMNNPATGPGKRRVAGLEVANETPKQASVRLFNGNPTLEPTTRGVDIRKAIDDERVEVVLARRDGDRTCQFALPDRFLFGVYSISGNDTMADVLPTMATTFQLDVPALLAMSVALRITSVKITFYAWDAAKSIWETQEVDLRFDLIADHVVIGY
jgi:hypothetical protein